MRFSYLLIVSLLLCILSLGVVNAETYQQGKEIDLRHPVRIDGGLGSALCNLTVISPNNTIVINFLQMTDQTSYQNYTLNSTHTSTSGEYNYCITCLASGLNQTECFDFFINPSGIEPTQQRTDSITRSVYFVFGIAILLLLAFFFAGSVSTPVRWTVLIVSLLFFLIGINTIFLALQDEVINPKLENFFSGFLTISFYLYYFAAVMLALIWVFTFINTWLYKKNMQNLQKFGGNY